MIPLCIPEIKGNEWKYIKECLDTNWVSSVGSYVDKFEIDFAKYVGAKKAISTMNGTSALELALRTLNIGEGDEVIVSSLTFIAPVNAIKYVGAEPVFVDVDPETWVMDVNKVEELITERTKAILPIHIYGHPVDMDKIMEIAEKYNLYVIEDATESLGSMYKEKMTGTIGHIGCYSFNGNKLMTTGAGGMLVTNNLEYANRAKFLSTQTKVINKNKSFYHPEIGFNFRMPNILAAMGCAQLENVADFVEIKRKNAKIYSELLANINGVKLNPEKEWAKNSFWLYSILITEEYPITRDELIERLSANGIESRPFFMPIHTMPPYKNSKCGDMSVTEKLYQQGLNLPSSVSLKEDEVRYICSIIANIK